MNELLRELAPLTPAAWSAIEDEAKRTLKVTLAARKLVDFSGPHGWEKSSVSRGRVESLSRGPAEGIEARLRLTQPLVELRIPFELPREEIDAIGRGALDPDLDIVRSAARQIALAEDAAIFHGYGAAGITGLCEAASSVAIVIPDEYEQYPAIVATAVSHLRQSGVDGPYAVALGPRCHTGLTRTMTRSGYLVIDFVKRIVDGPIIWAPGVDGAAVVSLRGGDYMLTVGQDLSIGYLDHDAKQVRLYLQESFTFCVLAAEAAVPLIYKSAAKGERRAV
jgi:uncharacterized linocin/CFP29 family protein